MKSKSALLVVSGLAIVLVAATVLRSQTAVKQPTSTIMGTLLDVNDARIVHAKVRIENEQFKWAGQSDDAGDFTAVVPPGTYRIYAEANGFRRFESPFLNTKPLVKEMVNLHLEVLNIIDKIEIPLTQRP
jgi:hypothetical protein